MKRVLFVIEIAVLLSFLDFARTTKIESCGKIESDGNFPWNVGIYIENDDSTLEIICFGSLIKKNVVLSAAHCFCDNLSGSVRNSTFYISKQIVDKFKLEKLTSSSTIFKISKKNIMINPQFDGFLNSLTADLALVKLEEVPPIKNKQLVCVDWSNNINTNYGKFGKLPEFNGNEARITTKEYLNDEDCIVETPEQFSVFLTNDKFCLKTNNEKTSKKDGGSGVVYLNPEDNSWYIRGVLSNVYDSNEGNLTTVTHIDQYLNWISNIHALL